MIEPTFTKTREGEYHVTNACFCGHVTKADVPAPQVFQWRQGTFAREAFPALSLTQIEALFVSGICGFCWNGLFPPEDDDVIVYTTDDIDEAIDSVFEDDYTSGEQYYADYVNSDSNIAYLNR